MLEFEKFFYIGLFKVNVCEGIVFIDCLCRMFDMFKVLLNLLKIYFVVEKFLLII